MIFEITFFSEIELTETERQAIRNTAFDNHIKLFKPPRAHHCLAIMTKLGLQEKVEWKTIKNIIWNAINTHKRKVHPTMDSTHT